MTDDRGTGSSARECGVGSAVPRRRETDLSRPFLTVAQAAEVLTLDESTLYRRLRGGTFPGVRIGGRYLVPSIVIECLIGEAVSTGQCVDVEQWSIRWREQQAARALAVGQVVGPSASVTGGGAAPQR